MKRKTLVSFSRLHWFVVLIALAAGLATGSGAEKAESAGSEFVAVQEGWLPVILSAPHGGQGEIPGVLPRKGERMKKGASGFRAERDVNADRLALETASALEARLGKKPYYVIAKFHRKFVDANRPANIAYEDPKAGRVYDAYHQALARFCDAARKSFGHGLVLDIHGQSSAPDTVFRGTQNGKTVQTLVRRFGDKAHIGPESFCGLLAAQGLKVYPTDDSREQSGYTGGYITQTCGAREGIGAIQLEFG
ncbi:MAG: N-formylglutamate amidohydrolase, partial [Verrucomicrobiae bacterium]|nr:N-formylglutamate amidohydrolase [Verrucomicrobiae bacterium]